jgi:protein phosphatase methylesterase 1
VSTNTIRNTASARISIPAIVRPAASDSAAHAYEWRTPLRSTAPYWTSMFHPSPYETILTCFSGWFTGLSKSFLAARTARLLVLAGADRLDRELMIGQMQGKFQMSVITGVGHMIQEVRPPLFEGRDDALICVHQDDPKKLAEVIIEFWKRNERVVPGVKKVGDA